MFISIYGSTLYPNRLLAAVYFEGIRVGYGFHRFGYLCLLFEAAYLQHNIERYLRAYDPLCMMQGTIFHLLAIDQ